MRTQLPRNVIADDRKHPRGTEFTLSPPNGNVGTLLSYAMPASVCAANSPIRGPGAMQGKDTSGTSGDCKYSYSCAGQISALGLRSEREQGQRSKALAALSLIQNVGLADRQRGVILFENAVRIIKNHYHSKIKMSAGKEQGRSRQPSDERDVFFFSQSQSHGRKRLDRRKGEEGPVVEMEVDAVESPDHEMEMARP
jgi:hypothetical protein